MKIAFRTDASLQIGSGHVMRCLTLAEALSAQGHQCHFVCREHPGNLLDVIAQRGFAVSALSPVGDAPTTSKITSESDSVSRLLVHTSWLGCDSETDASATLAALAPIQPDWLIVDHYALDRQWERALRPITQKLMVIDDLADRDHDCDLLLDQNLGRTLQDYLPLVPSHCHVLVGPTYALLRSEFARLRDTSVLRRQSAPAKQILISMGGIDKDNTSGQLLDALTHCALPDDCRITVVMGAKAPWLAQVRTQAAQMPRSTSVVVDVDNMAELMTGCDIAIGAAGGTAWERCCLGVPTILLVIADNQRLGAQALQRARAVELLPESNTIAVTLPTAIEKLLQDNVRRQMSKTAQDICDGNGSRRVIQLLQELRKEAPK